MININTHKIILTRILREIFSDTELSRTLGFKGGTAAHFFYQLPRFSVDIDLDLLKNDNTELLMKKIKPILSKYGEIKDSEEKKFTILFELSYNLKSQNIKVEINKRNFGSEYDIRYFYGIPLKVMTMKDMFANKLVATFERECKANRDIFDVYFFLDKNREINERIIETRTGMDSIKLINELIKMLKNKSNSRILSGLGDLVDDKMKKWIKKNLLKETIFLLTLK